MTDAGATADPATGPITPDAADVAPTPKMPSRTRQVVAGVITLAVLVIVFVGIIPKFGNYADAWTSIKQLSAGALLAFIAATVLNIAVYPLPYQAALPGIGYGPSFVVRNTSFMISNAVPAGGAIGLGVQYAMLAGYGVGPASATAAIGITSVFNLLVTLALPALGVVAMLTQGGVKGTEVLGALGAVAAVGVLIGVFTLILRSDHMARRIGGIGDSVLGKFRPKMIRDGEEGPATKAAVDFRDSTVDVISGRWKFITGANVGQQLTQFLVLVVAIYGMYGTDAGVNIVEIFAAFSLARLAGFIPITPGGLGTVDAAMIALLDTFGAHQGVGVAADLLWRASTFIPQVIIGIGTFLWWRRHAGKGRPTAQASSAGGSAATA